MIRFEKAAGTSTAFDVHPAENVQFEVAHHRHRGHAIEWTLSGCGQIEHDSRLQRSLRIQRSRLFWRHEGRRYQSHVA